MLFRSSDTLKRVVLELGGKDPMIVLEDADIEQAARFAAFNSFRNAGQVCVSTERIFVEEAVADQFEALLRQKTAALKVGPGVEEGSQIGPMIDAGQRDHVLAQIAAAKAAGARVVVGDSGHHEIGRAHV